MNTENFGSGNGQAGMGDLGNGHLAVSFSCVPCAAVKMGNNAITPRAILRLESEEVKHFNF
jgi:hypothetical protein